MTAQQQPVDESPALAAALDYADLDLQVFPCHTPDPREAGGCSCRRADCGRNVGKHPRTADGLSSATTDEGTIRRWWSMWPTANVAIRTGEASGIIAIDADGEDGWRALGELESRLGALPPTCISRTGRGGGHLVFTYPGRHVPTKQKIAPGVDLRGNGGYILVAPSQHASGRTYRWEAGHSPHDHPPAALPPAWVDFLCPPQQERPQEGPRPSGSCPLSDADIAAAVDLLRPHYTEGIRHDLTLNLAGWLAQQGYAEMATARLIERLAANDPEQSTRIRNVTTSYERLAAGDPVAGWSRLRELMPPAVLSALEKSLGRPKPEPTHLAADAATSAPHAPHLSDLGNAQRLVTHHGSDIRYCHPWGKWLDWDGCRWRVDEDGAIVRRAKTAVRGIYAEAKEASDPEERKSIARHALRSEADARIRAMISLAQSEPEIPVRPDELDENPWLLNCENGTLDLRTGRLRPHDRADRITKMAPVPYDPTATCPAWDTFLNRILADDPDLIAFVRRAVGYSLTGNTSERVLLILHGEGRNGKSTLLEVLRAILGDDYAMHIPTDMLLTKRNEGGIPNDVARLKGARFVSASEADEGRRLAEATIKTLTGGDTLTARFMRAEWFDFKPEFTLWLATNHRPVIRGTDRAIWDRLRLVPFAVRIPDAEQDRQLRDKLLAEAPGILAWAVRGCLEWARDGLGYPTAVRDATEGYRAEQDILGTFLADCCIAGDGYNVTAKELYAAYQSWCEETGEKPLTQQAVGRRLTERGFTSTRRTGGTRAWTGIGLRNGVQSPGTRLLVRGKEGLRSDAIEGVTLSDAVSGITEDEKNPREITRNGRHYPSLGQIASLPPADDDEEDGAL